MDLSTKYHPEVLKISKQVLESGNKADIQSLFAVKEDTRKEEIHYKFELFAQIFYNSYFTSDIETFHDSFIDNMIDSYFGRTRYVNLGFRGCGKTSFTKLFVVYMILNDRTQYRKYMKILTRNIGNAKQMVTDVYNMILEVKSVYGDPFVKEGNKKREETMGSFTTTDGRKLLSGTVGMTQRGHLQGAFRPDWIVFDDVEDRESISSLSTTEGTIFRIDEAIAGLSADGSWMVLGNYISEEGVIQWFLNKPDVVIDKIAIMDEEGNPTWPERYDAEKIEKLKGDSEDFYGEYLCLKPDTLIHTPASLKPIDSIKVGDKVISHTGEERSVLKVFENESNDMLDITVNRVTTTITKNHPVLTTAGWLPAGELATDDLVLVIPRGKLKT